MGAQENLERMLKLAEEREAKGQLVNTPEEIAAQERQRFSDAVKFPGPSGEFEPVKNRRLKHEKPFVPGQFKSLTKTKLNIKGKKGYKRKEGSRRYTKEHNRREKWAQLKAQVLAERGEVCECCNAKTNLLWLSHRNWLRKGAELPEDVELLCKDCFNVKFEGKTTQFDPLSLEYRAIIKPE